MHVPEEQMKLLQFYGQQYKEGWKGKSLALIHGKIGFRTGTPKEDLSVLTRSIDDTVCGLSVPACAPVRV